MVSQQGISKHPPKIDSLNYQKLREEGIQLIQKLAGNTWTDHNLHDPGITILEILCYALTDIGYQAELVSEALRMDTGGQRFGRAGFFNKEQLLPEKPITRIDFEKFIEQMFPQVTAAWVENVPLMYQGEVIHGGYEVALFLEPGESEDPNSDMIEIEMRKGHSKLEVILFDMENRRIKWDYIKSIEACTIDKDSFFPFEKHHGQVEIELEILYKNKRVTQTRRLKARINLDAVGFLSREGLSVKKSKTSILRKLGSKLFLSEIQARLELEKKKCALLDKIKHELLRFRNLCEHFVSFRIVNLQEVQIRCEVVLTGGVQSPEELVNRIYDHLDNFLLEMVQKAKYSETGKDKNILYGSNLIEELISIDGIEAAQLLYLNLLVDGVPTISNLGGAALDCIHLKKFSQYVPKIDRRKSRVKLIRVGAEDQVDLNKLRMSYRPSVRPLAHSEIRSRPEPATKPLDLDQMDSYYSIQNDFPKNYRLDFNGNSKVLPKEHARKIIQLKAYLFFFERLLVDYLERLSHLDQILSVFQDQSSKRDEIQRLKQVIPNLDLLGLSEELINDLLSEGQFSQSLSDKHRVLDHLLDRFASIYKGVDDAESKSLESKIFLLKNIPLVTSERSTGLAINGRNDGVWNCALLSGFEKRMFCLLGVNNKDLILRQLTKVRGPKPAGFYTVEHILLAQRLDVGLFPRKFNRAAELLLDFLLDLQGQRTHAQAFSFQLSVVVPDWYPDWKRNRQLVENNIREEVPAHILPHIHWLSKSSMAEFEILLTDWLEALMHLYKT